MYGWSKLLQLTNEEYFSPDIMSSAQYEDSFSQHSSEILSSQLLAQFEAPFSQPDSYMSSQCYEQFASPFSQDLSQAASTPRGLTPPEIPPNQEAYQRDVALNRVETPDDVQPNEEPYLADIPFSQLPFLPASSLLDPSEVNSFQMLFDQYSPSYLGSSWNPVAPELPFLMDIAPVLPPDIETIPYFPPNLSSQSTSLQAAHLGAENDVVSSPESP